MIFGPLFTAARPCRCLMCVAEGDNSPQHRRRCGERDDIIAEMAKTLVKHNATANERDALRLLAARGFRDGDVAALTDKALEMARDIERARVAAAAQPAERASANG